MALGRLLILAVMAIATVVACNSAPKVPVSTAALKKAYWGQPKDGASADVTSLVTCPNGYPCDVFANAANFNQPKSDLANRLAVIWTCQPQNFVLSEVVAPGLKVRMACVGGPPLVPRTISVLEATWGAPDGRTVDVTQQVREICGDTSRRCQVPAMAYIFGSPDRVSMTKVLRIRFTCNGQTTPGQQATENSVADLRCERAKDLE
ncbi:hypothetical protein [Reyranella sp.]|uniref:hypothetical protein n=1 Tax=Reyranella sp. TaxID=1929291 RepID=UPI00273079B9|nr:hypothetical protein [Reyranella sp.]MDP2374874.1 hypothetical protein [Reyranella sp.]